MLSTELRPEKCVERCLYGKCVCTPRGCLGHARNHGSSSRGQPKQPWWIGWGGLLRNDDDDDEDEDDDNDHGTLGRANKWMQNLNKPTQPRWY